MNKLFRFFNQNRKQILIIVITIVLVISVIQILNNIAIEDLTNAKIKMSNKNRRRLQMINPLTRFTNILKWKCQKFGTDLYEVNPAYTSQTCSCCGNRIELTLKDRIFKCSCGNIMDRDINAAINIAAKAICSSL